MEHTKLDTDTYKCCEIVFVLIGAASIISITGYGTGQIELNGHVVSLENCSDLPLLESSIFSSTKHGRNGKGCSFLLLDSNMYLTFL